MTAGRLAATLVGLVGLVAVSAGTGSAVVATSVPAEPVSQAVVLDRAAAAVGDEIGVGLAGWPAGPAQIELCGNGGLHGTADCDPMGAAAAQVRGDGKGQGHLTVRRPVGGCPCVVRVSQATSGAAATVPILIEGAVATVDEQGRPALIRSVDVASATISADEGAAALVGADVGRRVSVVVRNTGNVALTGVTVTGSVHGRGAADRPVPGPAPFDLAVGTERVVEFGFDLPAPAFGDYRFVGRVDGGDEPVEFSVATSATPWGLINGAAIVLAAFAVLAVRRARTSR
jgi:hypothetical protein